MPTDEEVKAATRVLRKTTIIHYDDIAELVARKVLEAAEAVRNPEPRKIAGLTREEWKTTPHIHTPELGLGPCGFCGQGDVRDRNICIEGMVPEPIPDVPGGFRWVKNPLIERVLG